jgi:hypothetical protein
MSSSITPIPNAAPVELFDEQTERVLALFLGLPPKYRDAGIKALEALHRAALRSPTEKPVLRGLDRRKAVRVAVHLGSVLLFPIVHL